MSYYYTCPLCGANLDPGERCTDCHEKEVAPGVRSTEGNKVDIELTDSKSTPIVQ